MDVFKRRMTAERCSETTRNSSHSQWDDGWGLLSSLGMSPISPPRDAHPPPHLAQAVPLSIFWFSLTKSPRHRRKILNLWIPFENWREKHDEHKHKLIFNILPSPTLMSTKTERSAKAQCSLYQCVFKPRPWFSFSWVPHDSLFQVPPAVQQRAPKLSHLK